MADYNNKKLILDCLKSIIIDKLCKRETVLSSHVNKEVLHWMQSFKKIQHIRAEYRFTKKDIRNVFKHVQSRLVLAGN